MAKLLNEQIKVDIDTPILDSFTDALELLLEAYEKDAVGADSLAGGVRDLITLTRKVPRSVTIEVEAEK